jgi:hypothetical protein
MEGKMYRTEDKQQLAFKDFYLPFGGKLNPTNRWVQLAQLIPWEDLEEEYAAGFAIESGQGAPAIPFRTALGALIIKEKLGITDEETVMQIQETPYLQYLVGMQGYRDEAPFDPSMMTHFRKRISFEMISKVNEKIIAEERKKKLKMIRKLKKKKILRSQPVPYPAPQLTRVGNGTDPPPAGELTRVGNGTRQAN